MKSTIQDKMRCAGVAYQQFLIALSTDQESLEQARTVFVQHFDLMLSQQSNIVASQLGKEAEFLQDCIALQQKIQRFYSRFERFYIRVFKQFREQHSHLISKDSKMAFDSWLQMFDSEYLEFLRQESVCREYAEILGDITQLAHKPTAQVG